MVSKTPRTSSPGLRTRSETQQSRDIWLGALQVPKAVQEARPAAGRALGSPSSGAGAGAEGGASSPRPPPAELTQSARRRRGHRIGFLERRSRRAHSARAGARRPTGQQAADGGLAQPGAGSAGPPRRWRSRRLSARRPSSGSAPATLPGVGAILDCPRRLVLHPAPAPAPASASGSCPRKRKRILRWVCAGNPDRGQVPRTASAQGGAPASGARAAGGRPRSGRTGRRAGQVVSVAVGVPGSQAVGVARDLRSGRRGSPRVGPGTRVRRRVLGAARGAPGVWRWAWPRPSRKSAGGPRGVGVAQAFPEVGRGPVTWPQRGGSPLAGGFGLAVRGRSPASPVMLEPTDAVPAVELVGEVGFHGGVIEPGLLTALRKDLRLGPGAAAARGTGAFPRSLGRERASGREGSTATKGQDVVTPGGLVRGQWRLLLPSAPRPRRSF